jgi:hypothetical protein
MARPKLPPGKAADELVKLRVPAREKRAWEMAAAEGTPVTLSRYVRSAVNGWLTLNASKRVVRALNDE